MLGKVKNFFCNWFSFGNQSQGIKRERDLSNDDQSVTSSVSSLNNAPNNKKLKLMSGVPHDRENHQIKGMAHTKRNLESKEQNWNEILKASALQTSTPLGSPVVGDAHIFKDVTFGNSKSSKEDLKIAARKMKLHQPLRATDTGLQLGEAGSSLSQIEKLVTERLGSSTAVGAKPKTNTLHKSGTVPATFNFTSMEPNAEQTSKKEFLFSSSKSPYQKADISLGWKKQIFNGGVQKPYRPMLQKLYGSPKRQKSKGVNNFSLLSNHNQSLAIQSCVRIEDKLSYKALLSQFVSKTPFTRVSTYSTSSPTSSRSSGIVIEKIDTKEAQSVKKELKKSVIELENESSSFEKTSSAPVPQTPGKHVVRINTLEEALAQSPQYDGSFVSDVKSRYSAKERLRERIRYEETIRSKVLAETREGWENEFEERVRKQLQIGLRPVLDERVEEVIVLPEITSEMHIVIEKALNGPSEGEVLCDAFSLTITRRDVKTLAGLNWLNDQIINFYLTLVMERSNSGDWPKTFAFNTFFYPKLMSSGHAGLKRWTRKIDLFQKDYILIPVHLGLHWCLATVCPKEKAIRYYDSMGGRNLECLNGLKGYMEAESLDKRKIPLDTSSWKLECVENIPQQMNGSDCGMFACKYAEYISRDAKITFQQKDMPYFRRRMVYEIITQKLAHP